MCPNITRFIIDMQYHVITVSGSVPATRNRIYKNLFITKLIDFASIFPSTYLEHFLYSNSLSNTSKLKLSLFLFYDDL